MSRSNFLECGRRSVLPRSILFGLAGLLLAAACWAEIPADECTNPALTPTTPSSDFVPLGDGSEVLHLTTGLIWRRCGIGQTWNGETCQGSLAGRNWQRALEAAENAGEGWRVPNIKELLTLVERCRHDPAINREVFPATRAASYWSSSPYVAMDGWALQVGFEDGRQSFHGKGANLHVRLVRGRQ